MDKLDTISIISVYPPQGLSVWERWHCVTLLQWVTVCSSELQCVARAAAYCSVLQHVSARCSVCCSVLQQVAVCCSVLQCVAACCSVLQRVAACCSVLFVLLTGNDYGVALVSRIDKIIGLFCKRALWKGRYSAKETCNFIDPTDRSHPLSV